MIHKIGTLIVMCSSLAVINCRPADDLPTGTYQYDTPSKVDLSLDANINPTSDSIQSKFNYNGQLDVNGIGGIASILNGSPSKIENAVLENESIFSKKDSLYTGVHESLANLFQYKPIVDTLKEEDKYGNDGEKFRKFGQFIVGKAEGLANFINKAIEIPSQLFKVVIQATSEKLNNIGAKIVGLAK